MTRTEYEYLAPIVTRCTACGATLSEQPIGTYARHAMPKNANAFGRHWQSAE